MNNKNKPQDDELRDDLIQANEDNSEADGLSNQIPADETEENSGSDDNSVDAVSEDEGDVVPDADSIDEGESQDETEVPHKKIKVRRDTRRLRYGGMATVLTTAVVAVVVLINVVAGILNDRYPVNFDLTAEKLFTLSEDSREVAKNVKEDTDIIVIAQESYFTSPNMGDENMDTVFKQFSEVTKQYDSVSGGKIKTTYVDLAANPALATKYKKYEAASGDILFVCGNRWQKANVQGLFSYDEEQSYSAGQMVGVSSEVEKILASNISMVTSEFTPIVTVMSGHSEDPATIAGIESVIKSNNFKTETLDITTAAKFNEESNFALIAAPKTDYSEAEIGKLRTWLNNDGKYNRHLSVVVSYESDCPNLFEFLKVEYGLEVTDNLILETDFNRLADYNYYATLGDVQTSDFTEKISGKRVYFPRARQILTNKENNKDNTLYNVDIVTFPDSAKIVKLADALKQTEEDEELKQSDASEYPIVGLAYATKWGYDSDNNQYKTNVMLSGSQEALLSNVLATPSFENENMLLSLFNGFTGNENAVTISSKSLEKTNLEFTAGQANVFFAIFVFAFPVAILVICLVVFVRRRRL